MGRQRKTTKTRTSDTSRDKKDDQKFKPKSSRKPSKVLKESGPAPAGLISPWHTECTYHRPWDAFLATGRVRLWQHANRVNIFDFKSTKCCQDKIKDHSRMPSDFVCDWCARTTVCASNMIHCAHCFDPAPFTPRPDNDSHFEGDFVFICKCCFEQHLTKSEKAKSLFDDCDHCQVIYGLSFYEKPRDNPNFNKLKEKYQESEREELIDLGVIKPKNQRKD